MDKDCIHHWKIAPPSGATAHGVCKLCGEEKEFATSYRFGPNEIKREKHRAAVTASPHDTLGPHRMREAYKE